MMSTSTIRVADSRPLDWSKCDGRVRGLEQRLEALLRSPQAAADDRRLARLYLSFLRLVKDRLDPALHGHLALAEQYLATGTYPDALEGVSHQLGVDSQQLAAREAQAGVETDQPFIYKLLESCTCRRFSIDPATDAEPIAWMAASGIPADDIANAVQAIYPELANE